MVAPADKGNKDCIATNGDTNTHGDLANNYIYYIIFDADDLFIPED